MSKTVSEDELHAFLDGELDPARRPAVEDWLAGHPEDGERLRLWQKQKDGLHRLFDPILDETVPPRLNVATLTMRRRPYASGLVRAAAALALVLAGGTAGWTLKAAQAPRAGVTTTIAGEALAAHVVFAAEVRHPVEVPASDRGHLVAWLSKRLDRPLTVPDLSAGGYALVGGRLLPAGAGPAAQFMYENQAGQRLTLYLRRNPGGGETAFRFAAEKGAEAFYWLDGPFGYALAGTLPRDALMGLAESVYRQVEEGAVRPASSQ